MDAKELCNVITMQSRFAKEKWIRLNPEMGHGEGNLAIRGQIFTEGNLVLLLYNEDKFKMLEALAIGAKGFCADAIAITFEGWHPDTIVNPDTGEQWKSGEMQSYVENHPGQTLIKDALTSIMCDRQGQILFSAQPYVYVAPDKVQWIYDEKLLKTPDRHEGLVPESLRAIMQEATVEELYPEGMMEEMTELLGEAQRKFHQEMATYRQILELKLVGVAARAPGSDEVSQLWQEFYDELRGDD